MGTCGRCPPSNSKARPKPGRVIAKRGSGAQGPIARFWQSIIKTPAEIDELTEFGPDGSQKRPIGVKNTSG